MADDSGPRPLRGMRVVTLAVNVPGPVAAARMYDLGAAVTKVEPPSGDPLEAMTAAWYGELARGQEIVRIDLKAPEGRARLEGMLAESDLLLTSSRPAAMERLGLAWGALHARHPRLCQVAITGHPPPREDRAGHDLTYQSALGLVDPPAMPRTLLADLAAAERAVSAALALMLERARDGEGRYAAVSLEEAAEVFAAPLRHGLTRPGGLLGGGEAIYGLYRAREGWVAVAALEPHFRRRLAEGLGLARLDRPALEAALLVRSAEEWEAWATALDLPLAAVRGAS